MPQSVVREPHLKDLQEDFELERWVTADTDRKKAYFDAADRLRTTLRGLSESDPSDAELVEALALALRNDPVLRKHVKSLEGTQSPGGDWPDILRAAAGTILECQYLELDNE